MSILEKIYDSALKFLVPLDTEDTYNVIVNEAIKLVGGQHGSILLESEGGLKRVYATSPLSYRIKTRREGLRYEAFKGGKAQIIHSIAVSRLNKIYSELSELNGKSIILIPLTNQNKPIGLLTVISPKDRSFKKKDLEVLKLFGSLASLAIKKTQLYSEVKDSLDSRDLFISLAAHELRTPLTTINGYIQLMLARFRDKKPIQSKWVMELALESQRLKSLIDEFLEINRITRKKLQYNWQECNIRDIAKRALVNVKFNNPTRKFVFSDKLNSKKDKIIGDPDKLQQVFNNVLENAEKYSPDNKKISITLRYESPFFVIEVVDQGQGIKKQDLPQIFQGFYKGENSLHEGMGLGLYLAKNIIDSHHGEIDIKSKLNKGTSIKIKLPKI